MQLQEKMSSLVHRAVVEMSKNGALESYSGHIDPLIHCSIIRGTKPRKTTAKKVPFELRLSRAETPRFNIILLPALFLCVT